MRCGDRDFDCRWRRIQYGWTVVAVLLGVAAFLQFLALGFRLGWWGA